MIFNRVQFALFSVRQDDEYDEDRKMITKYKPHFLKLLYKENIDDDDDDDEDEEENKDEDKEKSKK